MNQSGKEPNEKTNLLPSGGTAYYYGRILNTKQAEHYFDRLMGSIAWKQDEVVMFGKRIVTNRKTAWYGDQEYIYSYSNTPKKALPWTRELLELKDLTERITGDCFNSCLVNLYPTGAVGMSWHSDDEKPLGENPVIASLSLGAQRKFSLKHKETRQRVTLSLENGSLFVMKEYTQDYWLHSLPKTKNVSTARINLTFRKIMNPG